MAKASFRKRLELQGEASKKLRGTVGEAIRRHIGIDEACSICDDRVKKYRPEVRRRVLRRFSGPELRKRVQETFWEEPGYDPPTSPDGGASGAATAAPAVAAAA